MGQLAVVASERGGAGAERAPILPFIVLPLKLMLARSLLAEEKNGRTASPFSFFAAAIAMQNGKRDTELVVRARKPEENRFQARRRRRSVALGSF